jgi:hypothetical protein
MEREGEEAEILISFARKEVRFSQSRFRCSPLTAGADGPIQKERVKQRNSKSKGDFPSAEEVKSGL